MNITSRQWSDIWWRPWSERNRVRIPVFLEDRGIFGVGCRVGESWNGREIIMLDAIMISIVFLFLTGVVFICIVGTVMPLFINRGNAADLMPLSMMAAKVSIVLAAVCGVLELVSPGTIIRATTIDITTAVLFLWSCGLMYVLRHRRRSLQL